MNGLLRSSSGNWGAVVVVRAKIGTPFGVTVDFETLFGEKDAALQDTVTPRPRFHEARAS